MKSRYVYFVRSVTGKGPVKIGCSEVPKDRLYTFMAWAPEPLEIVATMDGGLPLERRFHALFAADHSHREWFRESDRLNDIIDEIRAGTFDPETLPDPRIVTRSYGWSAAERETRMARRARNAAWRASWQQEAH